MKLPLPNPRARRAGNDTVVQGLDAALTVLLFFGIGFGLDRWWGTTPWMMIVFTGLGAVGYFYKFKYRYELAMQREEAELRMKRDRERAA
ncbi:MAG: AtpZ/AtpI family protein [Desertimonas sp.]